MMITFRKLSISTMLSCTILPIIKLPQVSNLKKLLKYSGSNEGFPIALMVMSLNLEQSQLLQSFRTVTFLSVQASFANYPSIWISPNPSRHFCFFCRNSIQLTLYLIIFDDNRVPSVYKLYS